MGVVPLTLVAAILYNLIAVGGGMAGHDAAGLLGRGFSVVLPSHAIWNITFSDLFVSVSLVLLFIEVMKAARRHEGAILNHALAIFTFVAALVEFLLLKDFATTAFFLLVMMALFDVVAGFALSVNAARHDLSVVSQEHD